MKLSACQLVENGVAGLMHAKKKQPQNCFRAFVSELAYLLGCVYPAVGLLREASQHLKESRCPLYKKGFV